MADRPPVIYRIHATLRMIERGISRGEVEHAVFEGEPIEQYDDDQPYPSRLRLAAVAGRALHVVVAWNAREREWIVITAYEPDPGEWYPDSRTRRRR